MEDLDMQDIYENTNAALCLACKLLAQQGVCMGRDGLPCGRGGHSQIECELCLRHWLEKQAREQMDAEALGPL